MPDLRVWSDRLRTYEVLPIGAGPCRKQTVTAVIVAPDGRQFEATNWTYNPQPECPREGMRTGHGYIRCATVCRQSAHAEINALRLAGDAAKGAKLYVRGHSYACAPCIDAAKAAGIVEVIVQRGLA